MLWPAWLQLRPQGILQAHPWIPWVFAPCSVETRSFLVRSAADSHWGTCLVAEYLGEDQPGLTFLFPALTLKTSDFWLWRGGEAYLDCRWGTRIYAGPTWEMHKPSTGTGTQFQDKLGRPCFVLSLILLVPELKEQLTLSQQNAGLLRGARCGLQPPCKASECLHGAFLRLLGKTLLFFIFFKEGSKAYRFNLLVWRQSRSSFNFITDTVQTDQQLIWNY